MLCSTCTTRPTRCPITTDTGALQTCALVTSCPEYAPDPFRFPVSARNGHALPHVSRALANRDSARDDMRAVGLYA